jgi:predicted transcriptional regulator
MTAGCSAEHNLDYAIARLKEIREEIEQLQGMFVTIKKWSHITDSVKNRLNSALYELTGDVFYKPKKEELKHQ